MPAEQVVSRRTSTRSRAATWRRWRRCWAPDGATSTSPARSTPVGPDGVRAYFSELFTRVPRLRADASRRRSPQDDKVAVHWKATATMTGPLCRASSRPARTSTSRASTCCTSRDGHDRPQRRGAGRDGLARQIGLVPAGGLARSTAPCSAAFNARTKAARRRPPGRPRARGRRRLAAARRRPARDERLPDRGRGRRRDAVRRRHPPDDARDRHRRGALGGINRIVLGHADVDHRGGGDRARRARCSATRPSASSRRGRRRPARLPPRSSCCRLPRAGSTRRCSSYWDGGPVRSPGRSTRATTSAGFRVVHLPGHAPGLIALFRERDRLALTTDSSTCSTSDTGLHAAAGARAPRVQPGHRAGARVDPQARRARAVGRLARPRRAADRRRRAQLRARRRALMGARRRGSRRRPAGVPALARRRRARAARRR